jgi:hypothetical protein
MGKSQVTGVPLPNSLMVAKPALQGAVHKPKKSARSLVKEGAKIVAETGEGKHPFVLGECGSQDTEGKIGRKLQHQAWSKACIDGEVGLFHQWPAGATAKTDAGRASTPLRRRKTVVERMLAKFHTPSFPSL